MTGWISVNRSISSHWIWSSEPYSKGQAWIDLLIYANHTETKINIKGTILTLKRGQQARSMVTLAAQWKWSRDKVKRFLSLLESDGMIIQQTSQLTSIITICNYSAFQDGKAADKAADKASNGQQTGSRQVTVNNDNNENNVNNIYKPYGFDLSSWPELPEADLFNDWIKAKKKAKGTVSQRAMDTIGKELHKIKLKGYSINEVLEQAEANGWKGIKDDYFKIRVFNNENTRTNNDFTSYERGSIAARALDLLDY